MATNLTEQAIKGAAIEAERTRTRKEMADAQLPGLRIRVSPTGRKAWSLSCRDPLGRMRRFPLGDYPQMSLKEARDAARKLRVEIQAGADPIADRRRLRAMGREAREGIGTLAALLDLYADQQGAELKSWPTSRRQLEHVFAKHLQRPVAMLRATDLQMTADAHPAKQSAAAAVRYLRPVLKWAAKRGYVAAETTSIYPTATVKRRERTLAPDELRAILPVLRASSRPYGRALSFMLLTLARREEVGAATWGDIDLTSGIWTIPQTKNGKAHKVPLSTQAVTLLRAMRAETVKPSDLVFAAETGGRLANWDRETKAIQTITGTKDWHRHDLRRTGATLLGEMGFQPHVVEAALNHVSIHSALAATYNQARYAPEVRAALQALADRLDGIAAGGADVVPLHRGAPPMTRAGL